MHEIIHYHTKSQITHKTPFFFGFLNEIFLFCPVHKFLFNTSTNILSIRLTSDWISINVERNWQHQTNWQLLDKIEARIHELATGAPRNSREYKARSLVAGICKHLYFHAPSHTRWISLNKFSKKKTKYWTKAHFLMIKRCDSAIPMLISYWNTKVYITKVKVSVQFYLAEGKVGRTSVWYTCAYWQAMSVDCTKVKESKIQYILHILLSRVLN